MLLSLFFSIIGIVMCWAFQPPVEFRVLSVSELKENCFGSVHFTAVVSRVFTSSKGNEIAILKENASTVLLLSNDYDLQQGEAVMIEGRASEYHDSCWVFPEKVEKSWML